MLQHYYSVRAIKLYKAVLMALWVHCKSPAKDMQPSPSFENWCGSQNIVKCLPVFAAACRVAGIWEWLETGDLLSQQ